MSDYINKYAPFVITKRGDNIKGTTNYTDI